MAAQASPKPPPQAPDRVPGANHDFAGRDEDAARDGDCDGFSSSSIPNVVTALEDMRPETALPTRSRSWNDPHLQQQPQFRIKTLPRATQPVRLVGEGAANAVFELCVPDGCRDAKDFKGLLLRVAKVRSLGDPLKYDYWRQNKFFQSTIRSILGEYAVHQEPVNLRKSGIVKGLNAFLHSIDQSRKDKFKGTFVGETDFGFLVEDMRPQDPECLLIEFKPKWLSQSPSAPKNAIRCRQCAIELQRFITDPSSGRTPAEDRPCPLALARDAPKQVSSPYRIAPDLAKRDPQGCLRKALQNTANHKTIQRLRSLQEFYDPFGPLEASPSDPNFSIAMTLRDCTCFVQLRRSGGDGPVKLRLGDFDRKIPEDKVAQWRRAEADLISGGFYSADRILCNQTYYHVPTLCALEWVPADHGSGLEIIQVEDIEEPEKMNASLNGKVLSRPCLNTNSYSHKTKVETLIPKLEEFGSVRPGALPKEFVAPYQRRAMDPS